MCAFVCGCARLPAAITDRFHVFVIVCRPSDCGRSGKALAVALVALVSDGRDS